MLFRSWLSQNGWSVVTSEFGYLPKNFPELTEQQRGEVGEFLQELEDHDDVQHVWANFDIEEKEIEASLA